MPSSYSDYRKYDLPQPRLLMMCREVISKMGWELVHDAEGCMIGHIPFRHSECVDIVTIYVRENRSVFISSTNSKYNFECQRNMTNVEKFLEALETIVKTARTDG